MSFLFWLIATTLNITMLFKLLNIDNEIKELMSGIVKLKDKGLTILKIVVSSIPGLNILLAVVLCIVWVIQNSSDLGDIDID